MQRLGIRRLSVGALCLGALALGGVSLGASLAPAQGPRQMVGYAWDDPEWRFRDHGRSVKVALIAGSIGAFRDRPYGRILYEQCRNAEIRNLSVVGAGAPQLLTRFRDEIVDNPRAPIGAANTELWLLYGGGMNSVGLPQRSVAAMRRTFELAHRRGVRVVSLTLTPWGTDDPEEERWQGARALASLRNTRHVVDYVMGRLDPARALGAYRRERRAGTAPWDPAELPDLAIDLYDSPLRDREARPFSVDEWRRRLSRDPAYRRLVEDVPEAERPARLEADALEVSEAPRWFMRREYRSFDHIHPNRAGHEAMARHICPQLPASWGCECPR